jgi:hypothetical protein
VCFRTFFQECFNQGVCGILALGLYRCHQELLMEETSDNVSEGSRGCKEIWRKEGQGLWGCGGIGHGNPLALT